VLPGVAILQKTPAGRAAVGAVRKSAMRRIAAGGAAEGTQEYIEGAAQDLATEVMRRDKRLTRGMVLEALTSPERTMDVLAGALLGGGARAGFEVAGRRRPPPTPPDAAQTPPTPTPEATPEAILDEAIRQAELEIAQRRAEPTVAVPPAPVAAPVVQPEEDTIPTPVAETPDGSAIFRDRGDADRYVAVWNENRDRGDPEATVRPMLGGAAWVVGIPPEPQPEPQRQPVAPPPEAPREREPEPAAPPVAAPVDTRSGVPVAPYRPTGTATPPPDRWPTGEPIGVELTRTTAYMAPVRRKRLVAVADSMPSEVLAYRDRLIEANIDPDSGVTSFQNKIPAEISEVYKGTPFWRYFSVSKTGQGHDALGELGADYYPYVEATIGERETSHAKRKRAVAGMKKYGPNFDPQGALDAFIEDRVPHAKLGVLPEADATDGTLFTIGGVRAMIEGEGPRRVLVIDGGPRVDVEGLTAGIPADPGSVSRMADALPVKPDDDIPFHAQRVPEASEGGPATEWRIGDRFTLPKPIRMPRWGRGRVVVRSIDARGVVEVESVDRPGAFVSIHPDDLAGLGVTPAAREAEAAPTPKELAERYPGIRPGETPERYNRRVGTADTPVIFPAEGLPPRREDRPRPAAEEQAAAPAVAEQPPPKALPRPPAGRPPVPEVDADHAGSVPPTNPEALRLAFRARSEPHARIEGDLAVMIDRGALDDTARDVILTALYNTAPALLNRLEVRPMERVYVDAIKTGTLIKGYLSHHVDRVTGAPVGRARLALRPNVEGSQAAMQAVRDRLAAAGATDEDLRQLDDVIADGTSDASILLGHTYTFMHEFGHFAWYFHLTDAQRAEITRLYEEMGPEGRRAFLRGGVAAERIADQYADYEASPLSPAQDAGKPSRDVPEFVAHTFAEHVLAKRELAGPLGRVLNRVFEAWRGIAAAGLDRLQGRRAGAAAKRLEVIYDAMLRGGTVPHADRPAYSLSGQTVQQTLFDAAAWQGPAKAAGPLSAKVNPAASDSSIAARIDREIARVGKRLAAREIPRGRAVGASLLTDMIIDAAYLAALRAARIGIRGGVKLTAIVRSELKRLHPDVRPAVAEAAVRRVARRFMTAAWPQGGLFDTGLASAEYAKARVELARAGIRKTGEAAETPGVKAAAVEAVVKTPEVKSALAAVVRAEAHKAREAARADTLRKARAEMGRRLTNAKDKVEAERAARVALAATLKQELEPADAAALLVAVAKARTPAAIKSVLARAERRSHRARAKLLRAEVAAHSRWKQARRLRPEERDQVAALAAKAKALYAEVRTRGLPTARMRAALAEMGALAEEAAGIVEASADRMGERAAAFLVEVRGLAQRAAANITAQPRRARTDKGAPEGDPQVTWARWLWQGFADLRNTARGLEGTADAVLARVAYDDLVEAVEKHHAQHRDDRNAIDRVAAAAGLGSLSNMASRMTRELGRGLTVFHDVVVGGRPVRVPLGFAVGLAAMDKATIPEAVAAGFVFEFASVTTRKPTPEEIAAVRAEVEQRYPGLIAAAKDLIQSRRDPAFEAAYELNGWYPRVGGPDYWPRRRASWLKKDRGLPPNVASVGRRYAENLGLLKERSRDRTPILVRNFADVLVEHLDHLSLITHMARPVRRATAVLLAPDVRNAIVNRWGLGMVRRMERHLLEASLLGEADAPRDAATRFAHNVTRNVGVAALATNPASILRNFGGLFRIAATVGHDTMRGGLAALASGGAPTLKAINAASGYFDHRFHFGGVTRFSPVIGELSDRASLRDAIAVTAANIRALDPSGALAGGRQIGAMAMNEIYNVAERVMARALVAGLMRTRGLTLEHATREASRVFRSTQPPSDPLDLPYAVMATRRTPAGAVWQFTAERFKGNNWLRQAAWEGYGARAAAGEAANQLWGRASTWAVRGVLLAVAAALGADDEALEREADKVFALDRMVWDTTREMLSPLVPVPVLDTIGGAVFRVGGRQASVADVPVVDAMDALLESSIGLFRAATAKDGDWLKALDRLQESIRVLLGDPTVGATRAIRNVVRPLTSGR